MYIISYTYIYIYIYIQKNIRIYNDLICKKIIPARDPKQWGGAKGDETSGGDDDDDDTQMRAHRGADI